LNSRASRYDRKSNDFNRGDEVSRIFESFVGGRPSEKVGYLRKSHLVERPCLVTGLVFKGSSGDPRGLKGSRPPSEKTVQKPA